MRISKIMGLAAAAILFFPGCPTNSAQSTTRAIATCSDVQLVRAISIADNQSTDGLFDRAVDGYRRELATLRHCKNSDKLKYDRYVIIQYVRSQLLSALVLRDDMSEARRVSENSRIRFDTNADFSRARSCMRERKYRDAFRVYLDFFGTLYGSSKSEEGAVVLRSLRFAVRGEYRAAEASLKTSMSMVEPTRQGRLLLMIGEIQIANGQLRDAYTSLAHTIPERQAYTTPFVLDDFERQATLELQRIIAA